MKNSLLSICLPFLAILVFSFQLKAQEEVELTYQKYPRGPGGYRQLQFNQDGIAELPFANEAGKLLFKREGNELLLDRNGDGRFDKNDGKIIKVKEQFQVPLQINGKEINYDFSFPFIQPQIAFLMGTGSLKGKIKGQEFYLLDQNLNGNFGEPGIDRFIFGKQQTPVLLAKAIAIEGEIFNCKAVNKGGTIILSSYTGPKSELKLVTLKNWQTKLLLTGPDISGMVNSGKEITLIPGKYNIEQAITVLGKFNSNQETMLFGQGGTINLKPGKNTVKAGPPCQLVFKAFRNKKDEDNIIIKSADLIGAAKEKYHASSFGTNKSSLRSFIRSGKQEKFLSKLEYG